MDVLARVSGAARANRGLLGAVLFLVLLVGAALSLVKPPSSGGSTVIPEAGARSIATATFLNQWAASEDSVLNVTVLAVELGPDSTPGFGGARTWKVNVMGHVRPPMGPQYDASAWIYVDATTGAARIVARG